MARKRFTAEQIIRKLREAEILQSQGVPIREVCKRFLITDQTLYRCRRDYGA